MDTGIRVVQRWNLFPLACSSACDLRLVETAGLGVPLHGDRIEFDLGVCDELDV